MLANQKTPFFDPSFLPLHITKASLFLRDRGCANAVAHVTVQSTDLMWNLEKEAKTGEKSSFNIGIDGFQW